MSTPFFNIEPDYQFVKSARVKGNELKYNYYHDKVTNERFYSEDLPIDLVFLNLRHKHKFGDLHWCEFETFTSNYTFVVSEKFKSIIEQLILPPHRFYPATIKALIDDTTVKKSGYFVFHFIQDYLQEINFSQSQFALHWFGDFNAETYKIEQFVNVLKIGEIKNKEEYNAKLAGIKTLGKAPNIVPMELKFKKYYDILSVKFAMFFSEKAKDLVEENNITGINFELYDSNAPLNKGFYIPKITV